MNLKRFFRTTSRILAHPKGGALGVGRHLGWAFKRLLPFKPFRIQLTEDSFLSIASAEDMNGCAALAWSMSLYDFNNMSLIRKLQGVWGEGFTFFDVGANMGVYGLLASESPSSSVFCFEAHPGTAKTLKRQLSENSRKNVQVQNFALSDYDGEITFSDTPNSPINQVVAGASEGISIPCFKGETFCQKKEQGPTCLKLDVEGHELEVLRGFGDYLNDCALIFLEENQSAVELAKAVPSCFVGPFYVHFEQGVIKSARENPFEDAIYLNVRFIERLKSSLGFEVQSEDFPND